MKSYLTAICLTLVLSLGTVSAAWSADFRPSFDCAKARTQTENLICSETTLAEMDGALGRVYVSLRSTLSSSQADALLDEQRRWLKSRDKACGLKGRGRVKASQRNQKVHCLRHQLAARLGELESLLPVTARADFQKGVAAYDAGDYATALREWTPLAEQGNASAHMWLNIAASSGDKNATKNRDIVAGWMTASQLETAQKLGC